MNLIIRRNGFGKLANHIFALFLALEDQLTETAADSYTPACSLSELAIPQFLPSYWPPLYPRIMSAIMRHTCDAQPVFLPAFKILRRTTESFLFLPTRASAEEKSHPFIYLLQFAPPAGCAGIRTGGRGRGIGLGASSQSWRGTHITSE